VHKVVGLIQERRRSRWVLVW